MNMDIVGTIHLIDPIVMFFVDVFDDRVFIYAYNYVINKHLITKKEI